MTQEISHGSAHWQFGQAYAEEYLNGDHEKKALIAKYCEEQGTLAAIVCFRLFHASESAAREFIGLMINIVEELGS